MKIVIVEDELVAIRNLRNILQEIAPQSIIVAELESVGEALDWFRANPAGAFDLVLSDIQLSDGLSFDIYEQTEISAPIIFITAFDEYALRAFRANGIDYLLKPIQPAELAKALDKVQSRTQPAVTQLQLADIQRIIAQSAAPVSYRQSFVAYKKEKIIPIPVERIAYFYIDTQQVYAMLTDHDRAPLTETLDEIEKQLNPDIFFRANRQTLISRRAIVEAETHFSNRLIVKVAPPAPEKIFISKERASVFRKWIAK